MPLALYVFDVVERTVIYSNRKVWDELGYSQVDIERYGLEQLKFLLHPDDIQALPRLLSLWENAKNGEIYESEFRVRNAAGEWRWFGGHHTVFRRSNSNRVIEIIGTAQNITERKQAEKVRRELELQMLHTQKLESLGVLAGGIAHDFNNLLTVILSYASVVLTKVGDDSPISPMLQEIETASLRAADLTRQMLAYAGKGNFIIQPVQLNVLVEEMTKLLKTAISKKSTIELNLMPATLNGDATQINQVVMNLVTNASDSLENNVGKFGLKPE